LHFLPKSNSKIKERWISIPEKFGGLSGSPVVDEQGLVVGIVSNATNDPITDKKYFSPCTISSLISFLETSKGN